MKSWRALGYCRPTLRYKSTVKPRVRVRDRVVSYFFLNLQLEKRILTRGIPPVSEYFPQSNGGGG